VRDRLLNGETVPLLFVLVVVGILDWMPEGIGPRTLDCASVLLATSVAWKYSFMTADDYEGNQSWLMTNRLTNGLFLGNAPLQSVLMIAVTLVDLVRHSVLLLEHRLSYIMRQVAICTIYSAVFWMSELDSRMLARLLTSEKRRARSHKLVQAVLSSVCDAVCTLDEDLTITAPYPQLAGLLLRQCRGTSLSGRRLTDLMSPDDGERFAQEMAAMVPAELTEKQLSEPSSALSRMAQVHHTRLRDASNSSVHVELFCSCTLDEDDRRFYLIGINEDKEAQATLGGTEMGEAPLPAGTAVEHTAAQSAQLACVPEGAATLVAAATDSRVTSDEELSSISSASSDSPGPANGGLCEEAYQVWLDTVSSDLSILRYSASFSTLSASGNIGHCLREWMNKDTFKCFKPWVRTAPEKDQVRVDLIPPSNRRNMYRMLCTLGAEAPTECLGAAPRCLTFNLLRFKECKRLNDNEMAKRLYERKRKDSAPMYHLQSEPSVWFDLVDPQLPVHHLHARGRGDLTSLLPAGQGLAQVLVQKGEVPLAAFRSVAMALSDRSNPKKLLSDLGRFALHGAGGTKLWADFVLVAFQPCEPKLLVHVVLHGLDPQVLVDL